MVTAITEKAKPKTTKSKKMSDSDLVAMVKGWYQAVAYDDKTENWRRDAIESQRFYRGTGQWSESVKRTLEAQGRPSLTINRVLPIINVIWGQHLKTRQELRLYPLRGGAKNVADLGSALIQHGMDTCNGYDAMSDAFRDGLITGSGWMAVDRTFDNDPINGDLMVEAVNPIFVNADPRNPHYDANRGDFIFMEELVTRNKLQAYHPDKIDEIMKERGNDWAHDWLEALQEYGGYTLNDISQMFDQNASDYGDGADATMSGDVGMFSSVIVRSCWYRVYERVVVATVRIGNRVERARLTDPDHIKRVEAYQRKNPGAIETVEAVVPTLHLCVTVGDMLLKRERNPLNGMHGFPLVRFAPYWHHGEAFGVVDNLKDPQREHNKMRSTALHLLNQSGNTGWIVDKIKAGALAIIRKFGSTPGVVLERAQFGQIDRIKPEALSAGHMELAQIAPKDMMDISGANPDVLGTRPEQTESGRARLVRIEAGQTTMAPITANMQRSQRLLGGAAWDFVRYGDLYSPDEMFNVVDENIIAEIGGKVAAIEAMNDWDVGSYSVKADTTPATTTYRDAMIEEVRALAVFFAEAGLQVPPELAIELIKQVISLSSFPGRDKMLDMMRNAVVGTEYEAEADEALTEAA